MPRYYEMFSGLCSAEVLTNVESFTSLNLGSWSTCIFQVKTDSEELNLKEFL